jgi:LysR family hydrogen peroxide-inducible transcriptional activator
LPPILKAFARKFPKASVALHENLTEFTVRGCLEGKLDVGVIATIENHELLHSEPLFTEELVLALPAKHRLARLRSVPLARVAEEPFVLIDEVHCLGEQVIGFCQQQGCLPIVHCQSVQLLTIQRLVALGHGVSLVPAMSRESNRGTRCEYRRVANPTPTRTIRLIWHRDRYQSPLVKEFIAALRAATPPK